MFGAKVEIALREKNIPFEIEMVPFNPLLGYSPKHEEVLRLNPKGQVPVLVDGDVCVYDSTQIFEYLEDAYPSPPLLPSAAQARAKVRQLEHASDEVFFPHVVRLMGLRADPDPIASPEWIKSCAGINGFYEEMESVLENRNFLGDGFSYADIAFFMAQLFAARHTVPMTRAFPRLLAWRQRIGTRPAVVPVVEFMMDFIREHGKAVPVYDEIP